MIAAKFICNRWLLNQNNNQIPTYELVVLGCIVSKFDFSLNNITNIKIIQGSADRFGTIIDVRNKVKTNTQTTLNLWQLYEIAGADHSYNTPGTKDGAYENVAIALI